MKGLQEAVHCSLSLFKEKILFVRTFMGLNFMSEQWSQKDFQDLLCMNIELVRI